MDDREKEIRQVMDKKKQSNISVQALHVTCNYVNKSLNPLVACRLQDRVPCTMQTQFHLQLQFWYTINEAQRTTNNSSVIESYYCRFMS